MATSHGVMLIVRINSTLIVFMLYIHATIQLLVHPAVTSTSNYLKSFRTLVNMYRIPERIECALNAN